MGCSEFLLAQHSGEWRTRWRKSGNVGSQASTMPQVCGDTSYCIPSHHGLTRLSPVAQCLHGSPGTPVGILGRILPAPTGTVWLLLLQTIVFGSLLHRKGAPLKVVLIERLKTETESEPGTVFSNSHTNSTVWVFKFYQNQDNEESEAHIQW